MKEEREVECGEGEKNDKDEYGSGTVEVFYESGVLIRSVG